MSRLGIAVWVDCQLAGRDFARSADCLEGTERLTADQQAGIVELLKIYLF